MQKHIVFLFFDESSSTLYWSEPGTRVMNEERLARTCLPCSHCRLCSSLALHELTDMSQDEVDFTFVGSDGSWNFRESSEFAAAAWMEAGDST